MKILKSEMNRVYDLIESFQLSPSMFEFVEDEMSTDAVQIYRLSLKGSDFFYRLKDEGDNEWSSHYSPGLSNLEDRANNQSWSYHVSNMQYWLKYLKRELAAPDKWKKFEQEMQGVRFVVTNDEEKFSIQEYEEIQKRMVALKAGLKTLPLLEAEIETISKRLDQITDLAKDLNKMNWKNLFIGTMLSIVVNMNVSTDTGHALWVLIRGIFTNYFLN